ncbi:MAG: Maf family protein [Deltaproteobacteria bacterium]|nr:Maf family protein [Deltaproteobacteria bacterium]
MYQPRQCRSINEAFVVLASKAKWRSDILTQLGIKHRCVSHKFDEPEYEQGSLKTFVEEIALEKGKSIEVSFPSALIVSADQLVALDDMVFGKPKTRDASIHQLTLLNGKWHQLYCSLSVIYLGKSYIQTEKALLKMRELTLDEIANYVDREKPFDCCGSYRIESLGASLFEEIQAKDPNSIIGLPGNLLIGILRDLGFSNLM